MTTPGILHLIPVPIDENYQSHDLPQVLPPRTLLAAHSLLHFIVENAKSARQVLKAMQHPMAIQDIEIHELPVRKGSEPLNEGELKALLSPLLSGRSIGVMSESGCPGIADPGAELAAWAHTQGVQVVSHIGPSSLLLALMASGLQGQRFSFNGYLPVQTEDRIQALRSLEMRSAKEGFTQLLIETPYRNQAMLTSLLQTLNEATRLSIGSNLTAPHEFIQTRTIQEWQVTPPILEKVPTVFAFLALPISPQSAAPHNFRGQPRPNDVKNRFNSGRKRNG